MADDPAAKNIRITLRLRDGSKTFFTNCRAVTIPEYGEFDAARGTTALAHALANQSPSWIIAHYEGSADRVYNVDAIESLEAV